ncbi:MAG: GDP-mannose 4,6-dehydratase [Ignavibacterium sp.]
MNYLITGGAGFMGSHLVDRLFNEENHITVIDNFDDFYERSIKENNISNARKNRNFKLIEGDIRDKELLKNIFNSYSIDIVVHLASKAGVRPSILAPQSYYDVNVNGTLNILEAMREFNVKNMIYASSSSIYGNNKKVPFCEGDIVDYPISPYAATKKSGELVCHTYYYLYGFNISCLRFFTVYGPRQRPDLAIHKFAKLIIEGKPIPFYGDGSTERDYTYIEDIIDGIMCAINNLKGYDILNIGESNTISLNTMVKTLEHAIGKKAIIERLPMQLGDVKRTFADITKARDRIGYNPKYSFEKGIANFISWLLENK